MCFLKFQYLLSLRFDLVQISVPNFNEIMDDGVATTVQESVTPAEDTTAMEEVASAAEDVKIMHDEAFQKIQALKLLKGKLEVRPLHAWLLQKKGIEASSLSTEDDEVFTDFVILFLKLCRKKWSETGHMGNFRAKFGPWLSQELVFPELGGKRPRPSCKYLSLSDHMNI